MSHIEHSQHFSAFKPSFVRKLAKYNIRHIEQLASLLVSPTGEEGLERLRLGVSIEEIRRATQRYLNGMGNLGLQLTPDASNDPRRPSNRQGLRALGYDTDRENSYVVLGDVPHQARTGPHNGEETEFGLLKDFGETRLYDHQNFAKMIHADGDLPQVKDQGSRGTCVAFTATAMLESFIKVHVRNFSRTTDFSEQYLFFKAKKNLDPNVHEDGTQFEYVLDALKTFGVCASGNLPYRPYNDWSHSLLFDKSTHNKQNLATLAKGTRISGYLHLPFVDIVEEIKSCLFRQLPVGVGVLVFKDAWYENDYTAMKGEVGLPLTVIEGGKEILLDVFKGGHAITICGFEEKSESERPGGGGFIFRNSWGTNWAFNSDYNIGYGIIPYEYIRRYAVDACIITGLENGL